MIAPDSPPLHLFRALPAAPLRLLLLCILSACLAPAVLAQHQTFPIYTATSSVPAGSFGATFAASVNDTSPSANFKVCFDTGFGSSKTPIVPSGYTNFGNFSQFNFTVPPATIQDVPPSVFVNGSFIVSIYSVPTSFTGCSGALPGTAQGTPVTLNYPVLRSIALPYVPQQNRALASRLPSSLSLTGLNFINNSGTKGIVPSTVNFIAGTTFPGKVTFISQGALASTVPATISPTVSSVSVEVCNVGAYRYCSNSLALKVVALEADPGTLVASPNPAAPNQPVALTANFGPATHSVAGAPSGPVTFGDWGNTLGTAPLVLDTTASFVQAPTQQFLTYALPIPPIVADFNRDGIPDTLFIDPGTGSSGASLHLLLGTLPSGSFGPDSSFEVMPGAVFVIASAATGDFNGDGILDLALLATDTKKQSQYIYTLFGNGDGTFRSGFASSPVLFGSAIVAGDFNKDGKQDIVIAGALDAAGTIGLQTLFGDGKGTFTAGPAAKGLRTAPSPFFGDFKVTAADFNADGYPDIAVMNGYSPQGQLDNSIEIYQNTGNATFDAPVRVQTDGTATANFSTASLGPGKPLDLIVTSTASQQPGIYVALNQSTTAKIVFFGTFQLTPVPGLTQAVVGDFDGDGLLDVAVDDQETVHVLSGTGFGNFTAKYPSLSIVPPGTTLIAASDENGDSYADLLLFTAGPQDSNTRYPLTLYDYITAGTATATFPPNTFAAGSHMLHATTNGTFEILGSTANATLIVNKFNTGAAIASSPSSPATYGFPVTLHAQVFDDRATLTGATATGPVSFYNGTTLLGTATLADTDIASASLVLPALPVGAYSFSVKYPGDANHAAATSTSLPFKVLPATPNIGWTPNPATIAYGTPLSAAQLNAVEAGVKGETLPGAFTYAPPLGTLLAVGIHPVVATFTPTTPNYTAATATRNITVTPAAPVITWTPNPAIITLGTPLSAAQLDATANTPGTFAYTPALGTVLPLGSQTLSLTFTPADSKDFTTVTKSVAITIAPVSLLVSPTSLRFGNQPFGTTSTPEIVVLTNPGTTAVAITSVVSYDEPNPGDFLPTSDCSTLLPNASCKISVAFQPDGVGVKSGDITVEYTSGSTLYGLSFPVSGTGTGGILQVNPGNLKTIAGNGIAGNTGDGGLATAAELNQPDGVAFDRAGNIYIADTLNNVVRKVDTSGKITTVAGTGTAGYKGDGGAATAAELSRPYSVTLDKADNLFIQDTGNAVIRKVDLSGIITTFAGNGAFGGSGDGGPATAAAFDGNQGARFDSAGDLFVPQCEVPAIRKIDTKGIITTVAGNFTTGYTGDGGPATQAQLACPSGVAIDPAGNFYIADYYNYAIRKVDTKGIITTIAGTGKPGATGDGGPATAATLNLPNDIVLDAAGNLYIADSGNNRIRKIDTKGVITTAAGGLGSAGSAGVNTPFAVAVDSAGKLYFSDGGNNAVRELFPQGTTPFPPTVVGATAPAQTVTLSNVGNVPIFIPSVASFTLSGDAADFSLTGGTCLQGATLATTASTCTLQISFTPTTAGVRTLVVSIADDALNAPQSFTIGGIGTSLVPTLTWTPPTGIVYGTPLSAAQLDATATGLAGTAVAGTYTYTPPAGTVLTAGTHTLNVTFASTNPKYSTATASVPIKVAQAIPAISWKPNPDTIASGAPLSSAQLDATASTSGTFVYTPALGTVLGSGPQTLTAMFTPADAVDFASVTVKTGIVVLGANPAITWIPNPSDITYGTPLSSSQLDAAANTAGTFVYTPAAGTILHAGTHTLSVTFTPADSIHFQPATAMARVLVGVAQPVVTWLPNPATIAYGTPLSTAQLDATANTPGTFTYTPAAGTVLAVGPHLLSVTFNPTDTTDFSSVSQTVPITVLPIPPAVTWVPNPATITFGTPLSAAQLDATSPIAGAYTYSPANGAVLNAGTQTLSVRFHPSDPNYSIVNLTRVITVAPAKPTLTWSTPADITLGTALSATQLNATATGVYGLTLPGTFAYTPPAGTVLPAGTTTLNLLFTPVDAVDYTTATASVLQAVGLPATVTRLTTSASSTEFGQPVTFTATTLAGSTPATGTTNFFDGSILIGSSTASPASLTTATLASAAHSITAVFLPNNTFAGSASTAVLQTVTPAVVSLSWLPNPSTLAPGTALSAAQLDATASTAFTKAVPGTFAYTPGLGTVLAAGSQTLKVVFKPTDAVDYLPAAGTAIVSVTGTVSPVVSWTPSVATITYGTGLSVAQLDATASIPGTFTYTPALGTVLPAGSQTLSVLFTPTDTTRFNSVTAKTTITVTQAVPGVTWLPNPATISYGTALTAAQLDATSTTPGTFAYTPAAGAVLSVGTQTLTVIFTPTDTNDFKPISTTAILTVKPANPAITWTPNPATISYGTPLSVAQLNATSNTPGTFTYTPALGAVLTAGAQTLSAVFTPADTRDFEPVTATAALTITQAVPAVAWLPSPAAITYGSALTAAQLDATSPTPGTFAYTPALGAVLSAGVQTLSVVFTPTDITDFKPVTTTANITVSATTPTTVWVPNPATITFGTALTSAQLDAASTTPGTFSYTPALGALLPAGSQVLSATFNPTDTLNFKPVTSSVTITVTKAVPSIIWPAPGSVVVGTILSSTQLDATAIGAAGAALPGSFVYTPGPGTLLAAGTQSLKAVFTPTDSADYTSASASVSLDVVPFTLTALSSTSAALGDPAKTIILSGTGFLSSAMVQVNGSSIPTTFVNPTTLSAVIPASDFLISQILQLSVTEAALGQTTSLPLLVGAPLASAVFTGPSSIDPSTQPELTLKLTNPYPVDLTATFTLAFAPASGLPDDPTVLFTSGSKTLVVVIPANTTVTPDIQIQSGTVAGNITVALTLEAGGANVTPPSIQPLTIAAPLAVPGIKSVAFSGNGNTVTVTVRGFSNPRDMTGVKFHFTPVSGGSIGTPDVAIDVGPIFTTWYADSASSNYGSGFTYTQVFNLSSDASVVGQVSVTLTNSVGESPEASTP